MLRADNECCSSLASARSGRRGRQAPHVARSGETRFRAVVGGGAAAESFERAGIPHYATEADAVAGFMHLARYREALMTAPPNLPVDFSPDVAVARSIIQSALDTGRKWLNAVEAVRLLAAYSISVAVAQSAGDPDEAAEVAAPLLRDGTVVARSSLPTLST
jgi:acetyltransferase